MTSQWQNFQKNLGEWHGSFTKLSTEGELLDDTPSILCLESVNEQTVRLTLRRFPTPAPGTAPPPVNELVRYYQSFGRDILFFDNGAFSQGTIQIAPFTDSGAEFGFIHQTERLRVVTLFNADGFLSGLTLIRETQAGVSPISRERMTIEALLGEWQGKAITLYPDLRSPSQYVTHLKLSQKADNQVTQEITFGENSVRCLKSTGEVMGSKIHFNQGSQPMTVLLLPGGASVVVPGQVKLRQPLFWEAGWLIHPHLRQRMIRNYNDKGEWNSLTLITEHKVC